MTPERSNAYRRVLHTLSEVGPSKLLAEEQERIRDAADELLFSHEAEDIPALDALADIEALCDALVECGRWEQVSASRLSETVRACGPARVAVAQAA